MKIGLYTHTVTGEEELRITFNPNEQTSNLQGIAIMQYMIANPNYFHEGEWHKFLDVLVQRYAHLINPN